jgi:Subtilase family
MVERTALFFWLLCGLAATHGADVYVQCRPVTQRRFSRLELRGICVFMGCSEPCPQSCFLVLRNASIVVPAKSAQDMRDSGALRATCVTFDSTRLGDAAARTREASRGRASDVAHDAPLRDVSPNARASGVAHGARPGDVAPSAPVSTVVNNRAVPLTRAQRARVTGVLGGDAPIDRVPSAADTASPSASTEQHATESPVSASTDFPAPAIDVPVTPSSSSGDGGVATTHLEVLRVGPVASFGLRGWADPPAWARRCQWSVPVDSTTAVVSCAYPGDASAAEAGVRQLAGVVAVRTRPVPRLLNHLSAEALLHGVGAARPVPDVTRFAGGALNGTGQVVGSIDTGVDLASVYMRSAVACWPFVGCNDDGYPLADQFTGSVPSVFPACKVVQYVHDASGSGACGDARDLDGHGTHTSGTVLGSAECGAAGSHVDCGSWVRAFDGIAPGARLAMFDAGPVAYGDLLIPGDVGRVAAWAYGAGARVHTNSWGADSDGEYTSLDERLDAFAHANRDMVFVVAAGNAGTHGVATPGLSKNALTVGASVSMRAAFERAFCGSDAVAPSAEHCAADAGVDRSSNVAYFSSESSSGRVRPDIVAPGVFVWSAANGQPTAVSDVDTGTDQPWLTGLVQGMGGTSMAAPAVAGLAALVRQYFADGWWPCGVRGTSVAWDAIPSSLVRAVIVASTVPLGGWRETDSQGTHGAPLLTGGSAPSAPQGYGRPALYATLRTAGESDYARVPPLALPWLRRQSLPDGLAAEAVVDRAGAVASTLVCPWASGDWLDAPLVAVLAWTDPPSSAFAGASLVNDLDLSVWDDGDGRLLAHGNGGAAPDATSNVEVVRLDRSVVASMRLRVQVAVTRLAVGPQAYTVVLAGAWGPCSESAFVESACVAAGASNVTRKVVAPTDPLDQVVLMTLAPHAVFGLHTATSACLSTGSCALPSSVNYGEVTLALRRALAPEWTTTPAPVHALGGWDDASARVRRLARMGAGTAGSPGADEARAGRVGEGRVGRVGDGQAGRLGEGHAGPSTGARARDRGTGARASASSIVTARVRTPSLDDAAAACAAPGTTAVYPAGAERVSRLMRVTVSGDTGVDVSVHAETDGQRALLRQELVMCVPGGGAWVPLSGQVVSLGDWDGTAALLALRVLRLAGRLDAPDAFVATRLAASGAELAPVTVYDYCEPPHVGCDCAYTDVRQRDAGAWAGFVVAAVLASLSILFASGAVMPQQTARTLALIDDDGVAPRRGARPTATKTVKVGAGDGALLPGTTSAMLMGVAFAVTVWLSTSGVAEGITATCAMALASAALVACIASHSSRVGQRGGVVAVQWLSGASTVLTAVHAGLSLGGGASSVLDAMHARADTFTRHGDAPALTQVALCVFVAGSVARLVWWARCPGCVAPGAFALEHAAFAALCAARTAQHEPLPVQAAVQPVLMAAALALACPVPVTVPIVVRLCVCAWPFVLLYVERDVPCAY